MPALFNGPEPLTWGRRTWLDNRWHAAFFLSGEKSCTQHVKADSDIFPFLHQELEFQGFITSTSLSSSRCESFFCVFCFVLSFFQKRKDNVTWDTAYLSLSGEMFFFSCLRSLRFPSGFFLTSVYLTSTTHSKAFVVLCGTQPSPLVWHKRWRSRAALPLIEIRRAAGSNRRRNLSRPILFFFFLPFTSSLQDQSGRWIKKQELVRGFNHQIHMKKGPCEIQ